jgi:integrase
MDLWAHLGLDPVGFARESKLLCGFLLHCYEIMPGCKPSSAFGMVSAVRRIHKRCNVQMVSCQQLSAVMAGLVKAHITDHGYDSILSHRKEPIDPPLLRRLLAVPAGTKLGQKLLDLTSPFFLSLFTSFAVAMSTGFRKSEALTPDSADHDFNRLCRRNLFWEIDGVIHADPSESLLSSMIPLRDKAVLKPTPAKANQDGSHFGHNLIYLPLDPSDTANAASWLRRLALAFPRRGPQYQHTPLFFADAGFAPLRHNQADTYLHHLLCCVMPEASAKTHSFHSFRIGFACALLAAGASYDVIQALARWRSVESVLIYARLNANDYTDWISKAMLQSSSSTVTKNLPVIDDHDSYAALQAASVFFAHHDGAQDLDEATA